MAKVSIIANFYNSVDYIPKLMRSVAIQTFDDWELICVNDCSPNNDSAIIKKWAKRLDIEEKVKIIENKENLGISLAKKVGIDAATGEYITFIDGDDWLDPKALEIMTKSAIEHHLDYVIINYYSQVINHLTKTEKKAIIHKEDWNKPITKNEFIEKYLIGLLGGSVYFWSYWGKLYKSEVLKSLDFEYPAKGNTMGEDLSFTLAVAQSVDRVMFIDFSGYYWRYGGITTGHRKTESWTDFKYIEGFCALYSTQLGIIEKYSYNKARIPLAQNLINIFYHIISRNAKYNNSDKNYEPFIVQIQSHISHQALIHAAKVLKNQPSATEYINSAIIRGSAEDIYDFSHKEYLNSKKLRIKHCIITICFNLLKSLKLVR